jgi:hypothetical protein
VVGAGPARRRRRHHRLPGPGGVGPACGRPLRRAGCRRRLLADPGAAAAVGGRPARCRRDPVSRRGHHLGAMGRPVGQSGRCPAGSREPHHRVLRDQRILSSRGGGGECAAAQSGRLRGAVAGDGTLADRWRRNPAGAQGSPGLGIPLARPAGGAIPSSINGLAEWPIRLSLQTNEVSAAGYKVMLFYP